MSNTQTLAMDIIDDDGNLVQADHYTAAFFILKDMAEHSTVDDMEANVERIIDEIRLGAN
ncbi:hypothetical protein [Maritalea porphyrae]|uniref:hypothetical protein n=1 Tax=Maritalea porphyrae TaxID=880732 RepID=UPI0022B02CE9|nr:hypothetical protein [Maritalea porphyrae]MCZ4270901.1 hypothetical protein [Maritalea porphyrae]